ncbi:unnamed protein product [Euphydryas editha]|uniref:Uncharacterized protein n=1 Tax=Euphydryas editha TaxID=104508 RepID=A0AAU9U5X6_EUPED|nr:unnamed protein product [Euphydryas editha]
MNNKEKIFNTLPNIDVNNPEFYDIVQQEIDDDLARLKKNVEVIINLRMTAAEIEIETAALYHAELWYEIEDLKSFTKENINSLKTNL